MFGSSKPIPFERYGPRRSRPGLPRWLVLLLIGIGMGAGGLFYVQERFLPPRLSAQASVQLQESLARADGERRRLRGELAATSDRLRRTLDQDRQVVAEAGVQAQTVQGLRQDIASLLALLPPSPRSAPIAVRAARFEVRGDTLAYNVLLSREQADARPFGGAMELVLVGASERATDTLALAPVPVSIGLYAALHGNAPLPKGFKPRHVTVHVRDAAGKLMGQRILNVD